jgi:tetratricopeptide (TPR) repeat protein
MTSTDTADPDSLAQAEEQLDQAYQYYDNFQNIDGALEACETAIALTRPFLADAYNLRGVLLEETGRTDEARDSYNQALTIDPGLQEAADNLFGLEKELAAAYDLVAVATFEKLSEAWSLQTSLRADGILSFIALDVENASALPLGSLISGLKVQVPEDALPRTLEFLGLEPEDEYEEEEEDIYCPNCHSDDVRYERYSERGLFGAALMLRLTDLTSRWTWTCRACGHTWRE